MKKEHAYYCYGIDKFEEYNNGYDRPQNPNLITMFYGGEKEYVFHKENAYDLVKAICGKPYFDDFDLTKEKFNTYVEHHGLMQVMKYYLCGRGFVMVTNFKNYLEYSNGGQNRIVGITGMDLNGNLFAQSEEELFSDQATYEEMYDYIPDEENE